MRLWRRLFGRQRGAALPLSTLAVTRRRDYQPPAFRVERIELHFELDAAVTEVHSRLTLRRNPRASPGTPLVLDGRDLELLEIRLDGERLADDAYVRTPDRLTVQQIRDQACLEIKTRLHPAANTALEGLYQSGTMLCTQCEAHGFSRITYFPDRPDVMARYRVTLSADRSRYPVLLANGNPVASGESGGGSHWVTWEDPFPKPCYLFALVAGDLAVVEDEFVTRSGRRVALRIYVEPENRGRCGHAMSSLKQAMRWDEEAYGREYDLDIFMIVAVGAFNMGAMENKGLNLFNARYIMADPETATDDDHEAVRDIIGHEYFHNWTGNRITCRDWFQLSVKESLTVFREQQFSAAMGSPAIARIRQARLIRTQQFPEDAGPTAHPVRPDVYVEVNNLYTLTVYEKGAEVIRMIHTLLGAHRFRRGMDLYFERHDGQAVTVEDFLKAMEDASGLDLSQFRLWYSQSGTPVVTVTARYEPDMQRLTLRLTQSCPATPGQASKQPLHIPLSMALVNRDGGLLHEQVIELRKERQQWSFEGVTDHDLPSLLRGFSAPVRLAFDMSDTELRHLMLHSTDAYNSWDAAQQLYLRQLVGRVIAKQPGDEPPACDVLAEALDELLAGGSGREIRDPALLAEVLQIPDEAFLADQFETVDVDAVVGAHAALRTELAARLFSRLLAVYEGVDVGRPYRFDAASAARRRLRNICLSWLVASGRPEAHRLALTQYRTADNMSDALGALVALNDRDCAERDEALAHFHHRWKRQPLVLDKWLSLKATARLSNSVETVRDLLQAPEFDLRNPNRVRALLGAFAHRQMEGFHRADGAGYELVAQQIEALDRLNPQVAARLAAAFTRWRRLGGPRRELMRALLERLNGRPGQSADVSEIVSKSLNPG